MTFFCYSGSINLTLDVEVTLLPARLADVLAILETETRDSREPIFLREEFKAAPVGLCTMHIDLLFDGDRLTLCTGAKRPCLGRHSKYLVNSITVSPDDINLTLNYLKSTYFGASNDKPLTIWCHFERCYLKHSVSNSQLYGILKLRKCDNYHLR